MIVVGTTTSRTLESMYWCSVKQLQNQNQDHSNLDLTLGQHEWRELEQVASTVTAAVSLKAVIEGKSDDDTVFGRTSLMIVPGAYDFKVVDELVTNFHAPDSTLMLLVSAFLGSGQKVRSVYEEAQNLGYRFLSYGDVCYFSRPKK
jgi:S-adenosylmethionine:tRNA ribosyltransferase-isomerase